MTSPLLVDLYAQDLDGKPNLAKLVAAGLPWAGIVLKATQGDYYSGGEWFRTNWPLARSAAGARYGQSWFRTAYHYADLAIDPAKQAHYCLAAIEHAGGWGTGDLPLWIDVESAHNPASPGRAKIEDVISKIAEVILAENGRKPYLYGNVYLAENGVTSHMGCDKLVVARYTETLPREIYERIGWKLEDLFAWQCIGDGEGKIATVPHVSPIGKTDISVVTVAGGGQRALDYMRSHTFAESPTVP